MQHATPLFTDLYQLTMAEGYFNAGIHRRLACFDYFFRRPPFGGAYAVFAGLGDLLVFVENMRVTSCELDYLRSLGTFDARFLTHLNGLRFSGDLYAVAEGTPIFPMETVIRVVAPLEECQLMESILLNIVNYQCLVATKAARISHAARGRPVLEFGLRRAPGDGAVAASRAAYIGGCAATSNVLAAKRHGIPVKGTHGHSFVLAFENELTAFRRFAQHHPDDAVLLLDTYHVLDSGLPNAIAVGKEMQKRGRKLAGVRLDSGDLATLSRQVRARLDSAGLSEVRIICSGDLDEHTVASLTQANAPIDSFGIGTRLVTGHEDAHFTGVYKMAAIQADADAPSMVLKRKLTEDRGKSSLPGIKQTWRVSDRDGENLGDIIELDQCDVAPAGPLFAAVFAEHAAIVMLENSGEAAPLLVPVITRGRIFKEIPSLHQIRAHAHDALERLPSAVRRLTTPEPYRVLLGPALYCTASGMTETGLPAEDTVVSAGCSCVFGQRPDTPVAMDTYASFDLDEGESRVKGIGGW